VLWKMPSTWSRWPSAVNAFRNSLLALTIVRWASTSNAGLSLARVALPVELVAVLALKHLSSQHGSVASHLLSPAVSALAL